jgi:hypothetical protein
VSARQCSADYFVLVVVTLKLQAGDILVKPALLASQKAENGLLNPIGI